MVTVNLTSPTGAVIQLVYQWTFGDLAVVCVLLAIMLTQVISFGYEVTLWLLAKRF